MRQLILFMFIMTTLSSYAQELSITTINKTKVTVVLLDSTSKSNLITEFQGKQDNRFRKKWTARTFVLSNGKLVIEFYDRQAVLIICLSDFEKLEGVRFVKNTVGLLKKNVSYKIELGFVAGERIVQEEKPEKLTNLKSDMPEFFDFEVYKLKTGQILSIDKSEDAKDATIYPDLKTLSSDNSMVEAQVYGSEDDEYLMKKLAAGDILEDYDPKRFFIYPKYLKEVIKNHNLSKIEQNIKVSNFYGNLYKSESGYYFLIDEVNQKNGAGDKMLILDLGIYSSLQQLENAKARYEASKNNGTTSEHIYQNISNKYGQLFPDFVDQLIAALPALLNIDSEQISLDSAGIDIVDESIKWNHYNYELFDAWFPAVVAYYGKCYILSKKGSYWAMDFDKESKVWVPVVKRKDGKQAWDWIDFWKDLYEVPIPLRWAGNWDGDMPVFPKKQ